MYLYLCIRTYVLASVCWHVAVCTRLFVHGFLSNFMPAFVVMFVYMFGYVVVKFCMLHSYFTLYYIICQSLYGSYYIFLMVNVKENPLKSQQDANMNITGNANGK